MKIGFIHQNFPGQYRHLAAALVQRGDEVVAIGGPTARPLAGLTLHRYGLPPPNKLPHGHPWSADFQIKAVRAECVGNLVARLMEEGWRPDVVVGHPGWGELLAIKDLLPHTPVVHQVEFVYQLHGGDCDFDPEFAKTCWSQHTRLRLKRAPQLLALHDMDWGISPTRWQARTAPAMFHDRISVIHEGIDTQRIAPKPDRSIRLRKAGLQFQPGDELISFAARNLEPYRGFHTFVRMLPLLQRLRPHAHVVIVGGDRVSYGFTPPQGATWRQVLLQELDGNLDLSRIHFVGSIPHSVLHDLFRVTACHVYLTYPFVLSWSMLEAMACGALLIGSATAPVQEVIQSGHNGLLVDFFDGEAMAHTIANVLADPSAFQPLRVQGRQSVVRDYDLLSQCLPRQLQLLDQLAAGQQPTLRGW
jgi:glycosyltransferase involved in cell wall biosynthesis